MDRQTLQRFYWKQYLFLESDLLKILEYVELSNSNMKTYSQRILSLVLNIGSEIDNFFKTLSTNTGSKRLCINDYYSGTIAKYPQITSQKVIINDYGIQLEPFKGWNGTTPAISLSAWNNYNLSKHDRVNEYQKASLETAINLLAILFVLEMYEFENIYMSDNDCDNSYPDEGSKLFELEGHSQRIRPSKTKLDVYDDDDGTHYTN